MDKKLKLALLEMLLTDCDISESSPVSTTTEEKGRYIVLANRGHVVVGDLTIKGTAGFLKNASVIRRWGTTEGLGQLALEGPTNDTKLDPCGEFEFEMLTTCGIIPVKSDL